MIITIGYITLKWHNKYMFVIIQKTLLKISQCKFIFKCDTHFMKTKRQKILHESCIKKQFFKQSSYSLILFFSYCPPLQTLLLGLTSIYSNKSINWNSTFALACAIVFTSVELTALVFTNSVDSLAQCDTHMLVLTIKACIMTRIMKDRTTRGSPQATRCCR